MRKADQAKLVQEAQQLTKDWPKVRLGSVLTRSAETTELRPDVEYREITVRLWGKGVLERSRVIGAEIAGGRRFTARSGQFIASRIDARNGAMGIVPDSLDGAVVTNDFPLFNLNFDRLLPSYIGWLCRTNSFVELCKRASEGTTNRVRLQENRFLALEIPLPPLAEQLRIVARIEELATQIQEVRILQDQVAAEIEALVISVHIQLSGKRIKNIGQFLRLDEDKVAISPTEEYPQVGVRSFAGGLFPKAATHGTGTTYKSYNRLYDGAVVLSQVKGWEGAIAVCTSDLDGWFVSPEYRTFRCIPDEASSEYLATLFRTEWFWGRLKNATRGVGARRERTRPEQFMDIEIPIPDVERQKIGKHLFLEIGKLTPLQAQTATELDALLPSILDRAFKGELL